MKPNEDGVYESRKKSVSVRYAEPGVADGGLPNDLHRFEAYVRTMTMRDSHEIDGVVEEVWYYANGTLVVRRLGDDILEMHASFRSEPVDDKAARA